MSDDNEDAVVIPLRPGQDATDDDRPLSSAPREPFCAHRRTELRNSERRVYCRACGREVPAFDVLSDLCRDWERFIEGRQEAERRRAVALANLEDLLRDERNAKGRIRNARRRADGEAVALLRALLGAYQRGERNRTLKLLADIRTFLDHLA